MAGNKKGEKKVTNVVTKMALIGSPARKQNELAVMKIRSSQEVKVKAKVTIR